MYSACRLSPLRRVANSPGLTWSLRFFGLWSPGFGCSAATCYKPNCKMQQKIWVFNFPFPFSVRLTKVVKNLTIFNSDFLIRNETEKNWVWFCDKISQYRILRGLQSLKRVTDGLTGFDWLVFIGEVRKNDDRCLFLCHIRCRSSCI